MTVIPRKQLLRWETPQTSTYRFPNQGNPTLVHQTGTTILVPRPKVSIASSDREFCLVLLTGKATLLPMLFFALHKQDSESGSFKLQFALKLHSVPVVHFVSIGANWRISSVSRGFGLLGFCLPRIWTMCFGDLWNFLDLLHRFCKSPQLVLTQLQCSIAHRAPSKTVSFF